MRVPNTPMRDELSDIEDLMNGGRATPRLREDVPIYEEHPRMPLHPIIWVAGVVVAVFFWSFGMQIGVWLLAI